MMILLCYTELTSIQRPGFHLGFLSRGANATIAELRGGEDYSNTSNAF